MEANLAYYCRITAMHADAQNPRTISGEWRPPKAPGKNKRRLWHPQWKDVLFNHHGNQTEVSFDDPNLLGLQEYKTYSMYFASGNIWVINYDATRFTVHDGDDNDWDGHGSGVDTIATGNDWEHLSFRSVPSDGSLSYVTDNGRYERLRYQHESHEWAKKLFPDRYCLMGQRRLGDDPSRGGLVGEIPLLLGLVALSLDPRDMAARIPDVIRPPGETWRLPDDSPRTCGWDEKRGVLVEVWTSGEPRHINSLRRYEEGEFGKIFG